MRRTLLWRQLVSRRAHPQQLIGGLLCRNARKIADKYCRRQAELGVGDCAGLQLIPGATRSGLQKVGEEQGLLAVLNAGQHSRRADEAGVCRTRRSLGNGSCLRTSWASFPPKRQSLEEQAERATFLWRADYFATYSENGRFWLWVHAERPCRSWGRKWFQGMFCSSRRVV